MLKKDFDSPVFIEDVFIKDKQLDDVEQCKNKIIDQKNIQIRTDRIFLQKLIPLDPPIPLDPKHPLFAPEPRKEPNNPQIDPNAPWPQAPLANHGLPPPPTHTDHNPHKSKNCINVHEINSHERKRYNLCHQHETKENFCYQGNWGLQWCEKVFVCFWWHDSQRKIYFYWCIFNWLVINISSFRNCQFNTGYTRCILFQNFNYCKYIFILIKSKWNQSILNIIDMYFILILSI